MWHGGFGPGTYAEQLLIVEFKGGGFEAFIPASTSNNIETTVDDLIEVITKRSTAGELLEDRAVPRVRRTSGTERPYWEDET